MENGINGGDLLEWLGPDTSTTVFCYLDDPADLVRATAVSRSWRRFVIGNGFSKRLCMKLCPEVSYFTSITEDMTQLDESNPIDEWRSRERDYKIYTYFSRHLVSTKGAESCISQSIGASSTDNFPEEIIENTLEPSEVVNSRPSYWSSGGTVDPAVPESLTYLLKYDLAFVDEIRIRPFKVFFQYGGRIYPSKYVQFKMGYSKFPMIPQFFKLEERHRIADDNYVWTYTSPRFPMHQENVLQCFKLPRPALCIGGIVKVELLGRVLKHYIDNLFYIGICHVEVRGHKLSPLLGVGYCDTESGPGVVLKYYPKARGGTDFNHCGGML